MTDKTSDLVWGSPKKFSERKNERKISWLELFYDLVYVAAIGQLTHRIATFPTWHTIGYAFLIFCLVFWSWVNGSQYYDLHGGDSIRTRVLTFLQMAGVAAVAITIPGVFEGNTPGFAITFALIQIMIIYLWWSVGLYDPTHKVLNRFYTVNYGIGFFLLLVSVFAAHTLAVLIWIIVLILNLTAPLFAAQTIVKVLKQRAEPAFTASASIVERFGLFTIIVLTESILSAVGGVTVLLIKQPVVWVAFLLAILTAFLLWNLYFDMTSEQETKKGYQYYQWFVFLHFPLLAALAIAGACIRLLITEVQTNLPDIIQWLFCLSLATIAFMIVGITRIMDQHGQDRAYITPAVKWLAVIGLFLMIIPLFGNYLNSITLLLAVSVSLFIPVFVGVKGWINYLSKR